MSSGNGMKDGSFFLQPKIFKCLEDNLMSSTDYVVYSFLSDCRNNQTNQCFPSQNFIAKKIGVSRQTVSASIARLVELKLIKKVSPYDSRTGKSYTYEIDVNYPYAEKSQSQKYPSREEMEAQSIQNLDALIKEKNSG